MRIITLFIVLFCLGACSSKNDYDYYMRHPDAAKEAFTKCTSLIAIKDINCETASKAFKDIRTIILVIAREPQQYGETMIGTQIELAQLQQKNADKKELIELQQEVQHQLDLAKYFRILSTTRS